MLSCPLHCLSISCQHRLVMTSGFSPCWSQSLLVSGFPTKLKYLCYLLQLLIHKIIYHITSKQKNMFNINLLFIHDISSNAVRDFRYYRNYFVSFTNDCVIDDNHRYVQVDEILASGDKQLDFNFALHRRVYSTVYSVYSQICTPLQALIP